MAALGFVVGGLGFSWLASRSSPFGESFTDILWSTGIWSGLFFGVVLGLILAFLLRPRESSFAIQSPEAFRARLVETLPRVRLAIKQQTGDGILLHPTRTAPLPILQEETVLFQFSASQVTVTGAWMTVSRLRRKMGGW